jgi:hypothetical protein
MPSLTLSTLRERFRHAVDADRKWREGSGRGLRVQVGDRPMERFRPRHAGDAEASRAGVNKIAPLLKLREGTSG